MKIRLILCNIILCSYLPAYAEPSTKYFGFLDTISSYIFSYQKYLLKNEFPATQPKNEIKVSLGTDLCSQENIFLNNRLQKVTKTLHDHFEIDAPLKIAFCCSGGGNRAMIGMLGMLSAAAETNFLDATLYMAGVSGSTWAIIPYFYQQTCLEKNSLQAVTDLNDYFSTALSSGIHFCYEKYCTMALLPLNQADDFFKDLLVRYAYEQDISLVNLFGPLIAHQSLGFLGQKALHVTWSDLVFPALTGNAPLPICLAAFNDDPGSFAYFEMSPFESGNPKLGYIPTQYLGSKFVNLKLDNQGVCPEHSLGFYMGIYGSAFAAIAQQIYVSRCLKNRLIDPLLFLFEPSIVNSYNPNKFWNPFASYSIKHKLEKIVTSLVLQDVDDLYAFLPNYNSRVLDGNTTLGLFDAGIACNFPIAAFIDRPERKVDLIVMYDSHPGSTDVATVYEYAKAHGIPFDVRMKNLSINELAKDSMLVFNDPMSIDYHASVATILYFPTQGIDIDKPPYTTFNFKYEMNDIKKLKDIQKKSFISNFETIKKIMHLLSSKYK